MPFSGQCGVWAVKAPNFTPENFPGTNQGIIDAIAFCAGNGVVHVYPGSTGLTIPNNQGDIPIGVKVVVDEAGQERIYTGGYDNFNRNLKSTVLNVKDFPTFQAAHDALPSTGGTIFVPAGNYSQGTGTKFGVGNAPGMLITKPGVTILGEGPSLSSVRKFDVADQHGFDIRTNSCAIRNILIDGQGLAGNGNAIRWMTPGATASQLFLDRVYIDRSPSWGLFTVNDNNQFMSKIYMNDCAFSNAASGGDWLCGGSTGAVDNLRINNTEFSSPSFGGYHQVYPVQTFTAGPAHLESTDLSSLAIGDIICGIGIPNGAKVTAINLAAVPDNATLDLAPTVNSGSPNRIISVRRPGSIGAGQIATGAVHFEKCSNIRFQSCSWQNPGNAAGLTIGLSCANIFMEQVYREYATPLSTPRPWISTICGLENFAMDKFIMQSNTANPQLFLTAAAAGLPVTAGLNANMRLSNGMLVTNQSNPSWPANMANVIVLANPNDDLEIKDVYSVSSQSGDRFPIRITGTGAGFITVTPASTTMLLPNATSAAFTVAGTQAGINNITPQHRGRVVTLIFSSTASLTTATGNLRLTANFTGVANKTITLVSDGNLWIEVCRQGT